MTDNFIKNVSNKYPRLSNEEIIVLQQAIQNYYNNLQSLNLPVPSLFHTEISKNSLKIISSKYSLILDEELSIASDERFIELMHSFLNFLQILSFQGEKLQVSIDPKPSNFGMKENDLYYIDFLPPLIKDKKYYSFLLRDDENDQELEWKLERYFTFSNLVQLAFYRLLEANSLKKKIIVSKFIRFIENLDTKVKNSIKTSPFYHLLSSFTLERNMTGEIKEQILSSVSQSTMKNRDYLRSIYWLYGQEDFLEFMNLSKHPQNLNIVKHKVASLLN